MYAKYIKRVLDCTLALIFMILLLPLFLRLSISGMFAMSWNPFLVRRRPGRIGRDGSKAKCYLLTTKTEEETLRRLKYLEGCNDGFEIARFDLSLRGPGQILGVKQSGLPTMVFASLVDDIRILDIAQKDAQFIMRRLNSIEFSKIIRESNEYLNKKMAQAD